MCQNLPELANNKSLMQIMTQQWIVRWAIIMRVIRIIEKFLIQIMAMILLKTNLKTTLVVITMGEILDSPTLNSLKCKECLKTIRTNQRRKNYRFGKTYQISKTTNNNFMIIMVDLFKQVHKWSNSLTKNLKLLGKIIIILNRCILKIRIRLEIKQINLNE
jgi:hypothetical protein